MMATTHITFGFGCWIGYAQMRGLPLQPFPMVLVGLGSLLPDIDSPKSTFGRAVPFFSYPISAVFGHRGITHSFLAIAAVSVGLWQYGYQTWFVAPLAVGYLSHLAGDVCTNSGAPLFWPNKNKVSFPLFNTGTWVESVFRLALLLFTLWMIWNQFKTTLEL
jgi:inner membrane protein